MSCRKDVLREAEQWAVRLRRAGYTEVKVAPEYCIGGEIDGGLFTRTVCLSVGPRNERPNGIVAQLKVWWRA